MDISTRSKSTSDNLTKLTSLERYLYGFTFLWIRHYRSQKKPLRIFLLVLGRVPQAKLCFFSRKLKIYLLNILMIFLFQRYCITFWPVYGPTVENFKGLFWPCLNFLKFKIWSVRTFFHILSCSERNVPRVHRNKFLHTFSTSSYPVLLIMLIPFFPLVIAQSMLHFLKNYI